MILIDLDKDKTNLLQSHQSKSVKKHRLQMADMYPDDFLGRCISNLFHGSGEILCI